MSFGTMSRGSRTLLVGIGLLSVYAAYAALTRPWLTVDHQKPMAMAPRAGRAKEKSRAFDTAAVQHFEADSWVQKANGKFRDGNRLLFFDQHELFNDNRSIRVKPVALLWQENKDAQSPIPNPNDYIILI